MALPNIYHKFENIYANLDKTLSNWEQFRFTLGNSKFMKRSGVGIGSYQGRSSGLNVLTNCIKKVIVEMFE